jgi:hypothetical protein
LIAGFAGLLLDHADQLVDAAASLLQIVVGEFTPPLVKLPFDFVPVAFQRLLIQFHHSILCAWCRISYPRRSRAGLLSGHGEKTLQGLCQN